MTPGEPSNAPELSKPAEPHASPGGPTDAHTTELAAPVETCKPPRVLISYSHESDEHRGWVLALTERLRSEGVDARIDRYEPSPEQGWPRWIQKQITNADFIVCVCTATYRRRFEGDEAQGKGRGVTFEGLLATQTVYDASGKNKRLIPVLLGNATEDDIPAVLQPFTHYRLPKGYDDFYRQVTRQPEVTVPPLGPPRRMPPLPAMEPRSEGLPDKVSTPRRTQRVLGALGVLAVIACVLVYAWALRRPWPKADPQRYSVAVADLEGDDGSMKELILQHFVDIAAEADLQGMQILRVPATVAESVGADVSETREKQQGKAQAILQHTGASVLIWGRVLRHDGKSVPALYMTTNTGRAGELNSGRYGVVPETLTLPEVFWEDLGHVLALLVVAQSQVFQKQTEQYVTDRLARFIERVERLRRSGMFTRWTRQSRGVLLWVLGYTYRVVGELAGESVALEKAVAACSEALELFDREEVPLDWAIIQNILGSALLSLGERQAAPATLEQAVAAFRAALEVQTRDRVPFNWARTQHDLGIALANLGERQAAPATLEQAVAAFRAALEVQTRDRVPLDWAATQSDLGTALLILGERQADTANLEQAVVAHRAALEVQTPDRVPLDWAVTQNNLGNALSRLGERQAGTASLEQAVVAHRAALEVITRERVPLRWAMSQFNLGSVLALLGERQASTESLEQAIAAFRAALEVQTRELVPLDWAKTQHNLGNVLVRLGERQAGTASLEQAVVAHRAALEVITREQVPLDWATLQRDLGSALVALGRRQKDTASLEQAISAYRAALEVQTRERVSFDWAVTQFSLGAALHSLAERTGKATLACQALSASLPAWDIYYQARHVLVSTVAVNVNMHFTLLRDLHVTGCSKVSPEVAALWNRFAKQYYK